MRSKLKDLNVSKSIYDGRILEGEENEFDFDDLVINSRAYQEVMRTAHRTQSLLAGNSSTLESQLGSTAPQAQQNISNYVGDFLSNAPIVPNSEPQPSTNLILPISSIPSHNPEENLIDLSDSEPPTQLTVQSQAMGVPQPWQNLEYMQELLWSENLKSVQSTQALRPVQFSQIDQTASSSGSVADRGNRAPEDPISWSPTLYHHTFPMRRL
jgi:hypothetical protein